ncbi:hypothetical protein M378DRAFT_184070 [Amanita muscaria Koide BX008]|uniref:Translation initiation factor eIF2B subunit epsilon n=1 Tax=Amanita muscaria (strain Koide BX008) TaxID=946122 RepID=A0A0C2XJL2_AMAMK|nr:hypothetical protein M378DRAFT_184070 [Amanita muscaria Koide BX008]
MPPRPTAGKDSLITDEDEILQAVILADSFNKRFRPLTIRKPRCLLPVCNAPLLDWTFESLALAGVQEVFVVCRSHAEQIKMAIEGSKWSKPGSGMKIVPIVTAKETFSPGDAMRDIYTRGLVTTDFILVMGDLVSNIRIDEVVRLHKERRKTNKDAIMTIVVKESGAIHRTRPIGDSAVFALDSKTSECLHYQPVIAYPPTRFVQIPRERLESHPEIDIRYDLIDCGIDVCSVEVPSLFQDNFDYLDIRRDFVHGVLTSDLLMKNVYCHIATEGYAARVKDTKSYESVSKDILSRWTFPLVPDDNYPGGQRYEHVRGNRYLAKDNTVVLARTCKIGTNTLIGSSTRISEDVQIHASVIGQNCIIGAGTIIKNCYIFDHTTIGANCILEKSIIGSNVNLKDNSSVPRGCLIADSVIVGPGAKLEPFDRLSTRRDEVEAELPDEEVDSDVEEVEARQSHINKNLGHDSNALVWPHGPLSEEDGEGPENEKNLRFMRIGDDCSDIDISDPDTVSSESESKSSGSESEDDTGYDTTASSDVLPPVKRDANESEFRSEAKQSLVRAFSEGHSIENASVELKTLRMAFDVPLSLAREAVISAVVGWIPIVQGGGAPQRQEIARVIDRWGNMINEIGGVDPVETVTLLQTMCASSDRMPLFGQILAALYQSDIVEEDDIRAWHALPASKGEGHRAEENLKKCWMIGSHMLQQFDAQESEESESEGNEDDSE